MRASAALAAAAPSPPRRGDESAQERAAVEGVASFRPVPTMLAFAVFAAALVPAVVALAFEQLAFLAGAIDAAVVALCVVDFLLAPKGRDVRASRHVEDILSAGVANRVELELETTRRIRVTGEVRDEVQPGVVVSGQRQPFRIDADGTHARIDYRVTPMNRGDLRFGEAYARVVGPLGLCARQLRFPLSQSVKVYPDLTALTREALQLAQAQEAPSERTLRRASEGTEFESLREYRSGDDYRTIDWKATARRARMMVRVHQPERNQPVLLFLDCGRHMAGVIGGRRKLDHAVDAALRLAKVSLDKGDLVGVVAFAREVRMFLPPRKGADHLRAITSALYGIEASLEESSYGKALDFAFARHHRRTLVVLFTDLQDPETSGALLTRTLALRPRHLPLVVSLLDEDVERAANDEPADVQAAYVRQTAARLEEDYKRTTAALRNAGALALRAPASRFGAAAVNEYLRVKSRGML